MCIARAPDHQIGTETAINFWTPSQSLTIASTDRRRQAADQFAPAFRDASLDRNRHPVDRQRIVGGNDFVDTVWFATGIGQGTVNFVTQPGDRFSPDIVVG